MPGQRRKARLDGADRKATVTQKTYYNLNMHKSIPELLTSRKLKWDAAWFNFCINSQVLGSEFGLNVMTASIHPD